MAHDSTVSDESISGNKEKTVGLYLVGYVVSLVLTLLAFGFVYYKTFNATVLVAWITVMAFVQALVQICCFLRLNIQSPSARWNFTAFLFTILVIVVVVAGTIWIMYNLNYRMVH